MLRDNRVVLAVSDLSERGAGTTAYAAGLADRLGRPLLIAHAVEIPVPRRAGVMPDRSVALLLRAARQGLAAQARPILRGYPGLDVRIATIIGRPGKVIVDVARDAFVAVVGAAGHRSGGLLTRMPCPVIAVPVEVDEIRDGPIVVGVRTGRASEAGTAFATALVGGRPSYLVTVHPGGRREVNLESGALPVDRLIIRVIAPELSLASAAVGVAAEYVAALIVLERRSARWPWRSTGAAGMLAAAHAAGCPVAVVDPRWGIPSGASRPVQRPRARPAHALRPAAAVGADLLTGAGTGGSTSDITRSVTLRSRPR